MPPRPYITVGFFPYVRDPHYLKVEVTPLFVPSLLTWGALYYCTVFYTSDTPKN